MNYTIAIDILDLKDRQFTEKELKKAYYKKCLLYHPDKSKTNGDKFKLCNEAYQFLLKTKKINYDTNEIYTYSQMIRKYISLISEKYGWSNEILDNIINIIIKDVEHVSFHIIETLDKDTLVKLYNYLVKFQNLFHIEKDMLDKLREIIKCKFEKLIIYTINPSLDDIFDNKIYVLDHNGKNKYIPLWHNELDFDDCIIQINPNLPSNMDIDEDNNLNIFIQFTKDEMFSGEKKEIYVCDNIKKYIDTNELYCRTFQKYIFKNEGISVIDEKDSFNISTKGDIIVHVSIL